MNEWSASVELSPLFNEIDPGLVVWHGHYLRYFEQARDALLDAVDYNVDEMTASGYVWPVVDLRVKYVRPARHKQRLRVHARIVEWELRLKIAYRVEDAASGEKLTEGYTIHMAVELASGEACFVTPRVLREKLGVEKS